MRCRDEELAHFADGVSGWLRSEPVLDTVLLTVLHGKLTGALPTRGDERWIRIDDGAGEVAGAAMRTPPRGLLLSHMGDAAAEALAECLAGEATGLPDATGLVRPVEAFARRYAQLTGVQPRIGMRSRLYRLDTLVPPRGVPGAARPASRADRDLLVSWSAAFSAEASPHGAREDHAEPVDARLRGDRLLWLWEVDGEPVSMAWLSPTVAGMTRVSGVYTPPASRGRGYASACVAAASRAALDGGTERCVLFTDLANPTSNKIYQIIGYRPVADVNQWLLSSMWTPRVA